MYEKDKPNQCANEVPQASQPRVVSIIQWLERLAKEQQELIESVTMKCLALHNEPSKIDSEANINDAKSSKNDAFGSVEQLLAVIERNTIRLRFINQHLNQVV